MLTGMLRLLLRPCSEEDFKTAMLRETVVSNKDSYLLTGHLCDFGFPNVSISRQTASRASATAAERVRKTNERKPTVRKGQPLWSF